jgi:hypothetical protein
MALLSFWIIPLTCLLVSKLLARPAAAVVPSWATASRQLAARSRGLQRVEIAPLPQVVAPRTHQGHFVRTGGPARFGANV